MKIVIVEENINLRNEMISLVNTYCDGVVIAGSADNGMQGIETIIRERPDLVITNTCLPQLNGFKMVDRLRQNKLNFKIIFTSNCSDFEYARKAILAKASNYLLNPIEPGEFVEAVMEVSEVIAKYRRTA